MAAKASVPRPAHAKREIARLPDAHGLLLEGADWRLARLTRR